MDKNQAVESGLLTEEEANVIQTLGVRYGNGGGAGNRGRTAWNK